MHAFAKDEYEGNHAQSSWKGIALKECPELASFMSVKVANRLYDIEGRNEFQAHLRDLALTDFGIASLEEVLNAEIPEERDWAIGEALAEALLTEKFGVLWPWNMERDKRNPNASLPGADIVGFIPHGTSFRLALGEVKASAEKQYPPQVMTGRSGMAHQLDTLATNLGIIHQLLKWLHPRCKGTDFEGIFKAAVTNYLNSNNRNTELFGVLIRDTEVNELDLKSRAISLGTKVLHPGFCHLLALYLPHKISELPQRITGGAAT